jgi:tetratricopeptide (TPR) repeat protein/cold shock CspA family protein
MTRDLQNRAQEHIKRNEWQQAIDLLEQAQQTEPENSYVLGPLAFCYSRLKQHARAIELYERLCQLQPDVARWHYGLGYQYYDQQRYAQAIEHFDRALEIDPNYIVVLYRKGYALSTMDSKRGQALTTFERCREAYHALADGEAKDRERKHYAAACYQQGKLFLEAGNHRLAEDRLREAVELKRDDPDAHYALGKVHLQAERFDQAIENLKTAQRLSKQPQHYVLDFLARAHVGAGQLQEAIRVYEQMPPSIRNRPYILRNMGSLYAKLDQLDKAERTLQTAVKKEYRNHNGHYELGLVYQRRGKWAEAAQEFRKAIELRQKHYNVPFLEAEQALTALLTEYPEAAAPPTSKQAQPPVSPSGRPVGRVKKYFEDRGFGFLEIEGSEDDLFFHISEVEGRDSVQVGEYLEYSIGEGRKGPQAIKLQVVELDTSSPE